MTEKARFSATGNRVTLAYRSGRDVVTYTFKLTRQGQIRLSDALRSTAIGTSRAVNRITGTSGEITVTAWDSCHVVVSPHTNRLGSGSVMVDAATALRWADELNTNAEWLSVS